jgi:hypothetical protein
MKIISNGTIRTAAAVVALLVVGSAIVHACPNCGLDVLEGQKGGAGLAQGFTYSMVGMASAPFIVFTSLATYIFRKYRRH